MQRVRIAAILSLCAVLSASVSAQTNPGDSILAFGTLSDAFFALYRDRIALKLGKFGIDRPEEIDLATRDISDGLAVCMIEALQSSQDPLAMTLLESLESDASQVDGAKENNAHDPVRLIPVLMSLVDDMGPCVQDRLGPAVGILRAPEE